MSKILPIIATTPIDYVFQTEDGQPVEIPLEGAIGLLALGDVGLIAWRQALRNSKHLKDNDGTTNGVERN